MIICAIAGSVALTQSFSDALFSLALLPVFYVLIVFANSQLQKNKPGHYVVMLFLWAFAARLLAVYIFGEVLTEYIGMPFLSNKDDLVYDQVSSEIADRWRSSGLGFYDDIRFSTGVYSGFPNFSAALKYLFGNSPYVPRIGNAFLSAISCVTAYKICRSYASPGEAKLVGIIFLFSPLLITFASLQLKDTLLLFLTLTAINANVKILKGKINAIVLLQFILSLFFMAFIRTAAILPVIGAFIFTLIFTRRKNKVSITVLAIALVCCLIYIWSYISITSGVDIEHYFSSRYEVLSTRTISDTDAGIASTSLGKLVGTPIYLITGLFLPAPTIVGLPNAETINYDMFGVIFHYSLLPFLCISFFRSIKRRKEMVVPFFLAMVFLLLKVGQATSTMAILSPRQSLSTMFVMYLMLPLCFDDIGKRRTRSIIICATIVVMIGYAIVRLYSRGLI